MIVCEMRIDNGADIVRKFFFVWHEKMSQKSISELLAIGQKVGAPISDDWEKYIYGIEKCEPPEIIITKRSEQNRRWRNVVRMFWEDDITKLKEEARKEKEVIENARKRMLGA